MFKNVKDMFTKTLNYNFMYKNLKLGKSQRHIKEESTLIMDDYIEELMYVIKINPKFKSGIRDMLNFNNRITHIAFAQACMSYLPVDHKLNSILKAISNNISVNTSSTCMDYYSSQEALKNIYDYMNTLVRLARAQLSGYYCNTLDIIYNYIEEVELCETGYDA